MTDDSTGCETETGLDSSEQRAAVRERYGTTASKGTTSRVGAEDSYEPTR